MGGTITKEQQRCALTTMLDDPILLHVLSFLSTTDLGCRVMLTNKFFNDLASYDDLWDPKLDGYEKCSMYPKQHSHDHIQAKIRNDPNYLPDDDDTIILNKLPSRIHGNKGFSFGGQWKVHALQDSRTGMNIGMVIRGCTEVGFDNTVDLFLPHPDDQMASRHPHSLLLSKNHFYDFTQRTIFRSTRFCQETNELQDMFVVDNPMNRTMIEMFSGRSLIYLARQFPIECNECRGVTLHSVRDVAVHCATHKHLYNSKCRGERLVWDHLDPRLEVVQNTYYSSNSFSKCRLHAEYRSRVVAAIRSVPSYDPRLTTTRSFTHAIRFIRGINRRGFFDNTDEMRKALSKCREGNVLRELMGFVIKSFLQNGMTESIQALLVGGWGRYLIAIKNDLSSYNTVEKIASSVAGIDPERLP